MNTLSENITQAISDFNSIAQAIREKGIDIPSNTPTSSYAGLIRNIKNQPVYGVSGLYQSSSELLRTDDAAALGYSIDNTNGTVESDFDDLFPWSETEIVNDTAGKFVKFPRMYFRIGTDGQNRLTDIAVSKYPSGAGDWYAVEPFMYGCYGGSETDGKIVSVSGAVRKSNESRASYRTKCFANGEDYFPIDLYHHTVLKFLWLIEFAEKDSKAIMKGRCQSSSKCNTGGTDSLQTPSGFDPVTGQMRYHYIEDFVGNLREYIDGVFAGGIGRTNYVTANPADFTDSTARKSTLCYTAPDAGCISAIGWDYQNPFLCMPHTSVENENYNTYFCCRTNNYDGNYPLLAAGLDYSSALQGFGLFRFNNFIPGGSSPTVGTRLLKKSS